MNDDRKTIIRLVNAINSINGLYAIKAKSLGVKATEYMLFYALYNGEYTQKQLCNEWLLPKSTLNTIVKDCEQRKLIELVHVPKCKRDLKLVLTPSGKQYAEEKMMTLFAAEQRALQDSFNDDGNQLVEALESFCKNLKKEFEKSLV